jgi:hypothetical protein
MKNNYEIDVNHRREYVKTFSKGGSKLNLKLIYIKYLKKKF